MASRRSIRLGTKSKTRVVKTDAGKKKVVRQVETGIDPTVGPGFRLAAANPFAGKDRDNDDDVTQHTASEEEHNKKTHEEEDDDDNNDDDNMIQEPKEEKSEERGEEEESKESEDQVAADEMGSNNKNKKEKKKDDATTTFKIHLDPARLLVDSGFLWKKGGGSRGSKARGRRLSIQRSNWKRRYFELRPATMTMSYFSSDESGAKKELGSFAISPATLTCVDANATPRKHNAPNIDDARIFYLHTQSGSFELCAETEADFDKWFKTLGYVVDSVAKARHENNVSLDI